MDVDDPAVRGDHGRGHGPLPRVRQHERDRDTGRGHGGRGAPRRPDPGVDGARRGGGNYLSNEIAYRVTLLRDRLGLHDRLPGGHLHTPVLQFGAGNTDPATGTVTDPEFVRDRLDIVAQVRSVLAVAVAATGPVRR